jgi:nucleotide-binding universal stress UspA family protein
MNRQSGRIVVGYDEAKHAAQAVDLAAGPGPARPVVVGVDGWAASQAALEYAAGTAEIASAPLVVVRAWNDIARYSRWVSVDTRVVIDRDDLLNTEQKAAREDLHAAQDWVRTRYPDLTVTLVLVEGAPADSLLRVGAEAGLLVVGTRGHGALAALLLGSVSRAVVHRATRPVAVVRAGVEMPLMRTQAPEPALTGAGR